jgi:hypothetical protein
MATCEACHREDDKHAKDCPLLPGLLEEALNRKWNERAHDIAQELGIYPPAIRASGNLITLMSYTISLRAKLADIEPWMTREAFEWMDAALGLAAQLHGGLKALIPSPESLSVADRANWQIVVNTIYKSAKHADAMPQVLKDRAPWDFGRNKTPKVHLSEIAHYTGNDLANLHAEAEVYLQTEPAWTDRLSRLAEKYGSDKCPAIFHGYTPFYDSLLRGRDVKRVLEIGIGSQARMTHMPQYEPGASLRMWRDYFPEADIFGLDNDLDVMFAEPNIYTMSCDQSNEASLLEVAERLLVDGKFDLIIDDGSHVVEHQALTANTFIPKLLAPSGVYVIEDIWDRARLYSLLPKWPVEVKLFDLRRTPDDCLFVIEGSNIY